MCINREELIEVINKAFDGVKQPTKITLLVAETHDKYDYKNDLKWRRKDYKGPWQGIPDELIKTCQAVLSFVDNYGMRFYLPAYMTWYLKYYKETEVAWSDHTLYSLDNYPNDRKLSAYHKEQFSLFTPDQMKACALFIKYLSEADDDFTDTDFARRKYEQYWRQYK